MDSRRHLSGQALFARSRSVLALALTAAVCGLTMAAPEERVSNSQIFGSGSINRSQLDFQGFSIHMRGEVLPNGKVDGGHLFGSEAAFGKSEFNEGITPKDIKEAALNLINFKGEPNNPNMKPWVKSNRSYVLDATSTKYGRMRVVIRDTHNPKVKKLVTVYLLRN